MSSYLERSSPLTRAAMPDREARREKRRPSWQPPPFAVSAGRAPLRPRPELVEVQNGDHRLSGEIVVPFGAVCPPLCHGLILRNR